MSFAQFDDICEICYGMMEEEEEITVENKKAGSEILDRKALLTNSKRKRREIEGREFIKDKERQLIYK